VLWSDEAESELSSLESAAEAFARLLGAQQPLITVASVATLWMWVPGKSELDLRKLQALSQHQRGVRMALGSQARGVEGFRRSHLDALTAQRMLVRLRSSERVVSFDEVRLVSLVTQDAQGAHAFVQHTLGELASASAELQRALWMFLRAGCNVSRAAELLRTHRNTLLRRLTRAESLLPRPLEEQRVNVAVALDLLRWQQQS
jgi:DNA-binding PucR family transcriptional regulator